MNEWRDCNVRVPVAVGAEKKEERQAGCTRQLYNVIVVEHTKRYLKVHAAAASREYMVQLRSKSVMRLFDPHVATQQSSNPPMYHDASNVYRSTCITMLHSPPGTAKLTNEMSAVLSTSQCFRLVFLFAEHLRMALISESRQQASETWRIAGQATCLHPKPLQGSLLPAAPRVRPLVCACFAEMPQLHC